jgi:hypothetical protein
VSLPIHVNLITAAMDLKLIRLLRGAMQPKLPHAPGAHGVPGPAPTLPGRPTHQASPALLPPTVVQPPPLLRPPPIIFFRPIFKEIPLECATPPHAGPTSHTMPLQPPWKSLPWKSPLPPPPLIKVVQHRPDIISKGSLIDFYM